MSALSYLSVRGLEPRIHRLKVGCFIQLSYALLLFDFEQIRTVDMENHFGFTVQRFRPTELRNHFINLTKNQYLLAIYIKPIKVIISYFFQKIRKKASYLYLFSIYLSLIQLLNNTFIPRIKITYIPLINLIRSSRTRIIIFIFSLLYAHDRQRPNCLTTF